MNASIPDFRKFFSDINQLLDENKTGKDNGCNKFRSLRFDISLIGRQQITNRLVFSIFGLQVNMRECSYHANDL